MNRRPTQFDTREITASSRQHASRFAARLPQLQPESTSVSALEERQSHCPTPASTEIVSPLIRELKNRATAGEERCNGHLLTVLEVAELLRVPISWVYERTRGRGPAQLPHLKIGKYLRFEEPALTEFIRRQRCA